MRSDLYKKLRDVAKAGMTELKYIDLQKGQFRNFTKEHPLPLPALLVEFKNGQYTNVGKLDQMGDMMISIYLYLDNFGESFSGSKSEDKSLALLDKMDEVFQTFQGVSCEMFSKLIRTADETQEIKDNYICFRTDFSTGIKDVKTVTTKKLTSIPTIQLTAL